MNCEFLFIFIFKTFARVEGFEPSSTDLESVLLASYNKPVLLFPNFLILLPISIGITLLIFHLTAVPRGIEPRYPVFHSGAYIHSAKAPFVCDEH